MRLTYKTDNGEYTGMPNYIPIRQALEKLSQLEDIEEELGIDLVTLFKALKNGIYVSKNDKRFIPIILCHEDLTLDLEIGYQDYVSIKDYGKTWALNDEVLK